MNILYKYHKYLIETEKALKIGNHKISGKFTITIISETDNFYRISITRVKDKHLRYQIINVKNRYSYTYNECHDFLINKKTLLKFLSKYNNEVRRKVRINNIIC